jgi:hypothetical protein
VSKGKTMLEDVIVERRIFSKEAVRKYVGFIPDRQNITTSVVF